ncbi:MAG: hypothetical protein ACKOFA_06700 [Rhodoluna sp.]
MSPLKIEDLIPHPFDYSDYVQEHGMRHLLNDTATDSANYTRRNPGTLKVLDPQNTTPLPPEYDDLCRLHAICRNRKVCTVLEFGVGMSTIVLTDAIRRNKNDHGHYVTSELRIANPYEIHSVDNYESWINQAANSMPSELSDARICHFHLAKVTMGTFCGRICTYYDPLPALSPDLIYIDGPDQFSALGDIRGVSTRHRDKMPMAADVLTIEHFLEPGTLIIIDGRTANARFLAKNLQRDWAYLHVPSWDHHFFELQESPLGHWNQKKIEYCLGPDFYRRSE